MTTDSGFRDLLCIILITLFGFVVYANSVNGGFVWDDHILVKDNPLIKCRANAPAIFRECLLGGARKDIHLFRPVQMLTYMFDYSLWKLNVAGYHLTNILLHVSAGLGVFWLVNILFRDRTISLLTGMLFVVHPIHVEAVAYISGRADPLSAIFVLLTVIFYVKGVVSRRIYFGVLAGLSYAIALLTRESSIAVPAILCLYHYTFRRKIRSADILPVVIITAVYIAARMTLLRGAISPSYGTLPGRIPGFFAAVTGYLRLLVLPLDLHMEYGKKLFEPLRPEVITGILASGGLIFYALKKRRHNALVFFSIAWFFIMLAPQSNLYPINAYMAEHWLYLPSVGFFLMISGCIAAFYHNGRRALGVAAAAILVAYYSYLTVQQNIYWRYPAHLYERTAKFSPSNPGLLNNLGMQYEAEGRTEDAIAQYMRALEIDPKFADAYNNLGRLYAGAGRRYEAARLIAMAIDIDPGCANAYNNLGNLYSDMGRIGDAIDMYKKAIAADPLLSAAYNNLGNRYTEISRRDEAITLYRKAVAINPDLAAAYNNMARIYYDKRQDDEAVALLEKAIAIDPNFAVAKRTLSRIKQDRAS